MAKSSVLVTGGAGYLGSVLVPILLQQGYRVTVLDNFLFLQNSLAGVCHNPDFDVVKGDVRDERLIEELVAKADIVIPLAALVGAPICDADPTGAVTVNRDAIVTLLKHIGTDRKLLMPITNSGYGVGEAGKLCTEESPLKPVSLYGTTKVEAEAAVLASGNGLSFRLATVFGVAPRMRVDLLVNDFVYRAVNDSALVLFEARFKRNFIHVIDVARAFVHGIENYDTMNGEPFNVGLSDANLSKWELCERIKRHCPNFAFFESEIRADPDKRDYIVSNEKIEATGYLPKYSLDDGIRELIKGYRMIRDREYGNA